MEDRRGKLGLRGRHELIRLIEEGHSLRAAARATGVAPATAHRWWHRWRAASEHERGSLSCLASRPPIPRSCPWRLDEATERRILAARERTNLGPARLAGLVGRRRFDDLEGAAPQRLLGAPAFGAAGPADPAL